MKKLLYNPLTAIIVTIVFIILSISIQHKLKKVKIAQDNMHQLEGVVAEMELNLEQKQAKLKRAQTNFAKEQILRNELLMQKPSEQVIQVSNLPEQKEIGEQELISPWEEWKRLLL